MPSSEEAYESLPSQVPFGYLGSPRDSGDVAQDLYKQIQDHSSIESRCSTLAQAATGAFVALCGFNACYAFPSEDRTKALVFALSNFGIIIGNGFSFLTAGSLGKRMKKIFLCALIGQATIFPHLFIKQETLLEKFKAEALITTIYSLSLALLWTITCTKKEEITLKRFVKYFAIAYIAVGGHKTCGLLLNSALATSIGNTIIGLASILAFPPVPEKRQRVIVALSLLGLPAIALASKTIEDSTNTEVAIGISNAWNFFFLMAMWYQGRRRLIKDLTPHSVEDNNIP